MMTTRNAIRDKTNSPSNAAAAVMMSPVVWVLLLIYVMTGCAVAPDVEDPLPEPASQPVASDAPGMTTGTSYPFRQSGIEPYMRLDKVSSDETYGYTRVNPIKIGGGFPGGDMEICRYLNALLDPNGEPISYSRQGTCCPFEHDPGLLGSGEGILDVYLIYHDALEGPVRLYFNTFDFERPVAPMGLTYIEE